MTYRIIMLAIIGSLLLSGCAAKPTGSPKKAAHSTSITALCQPQGTVYVLPGGSGASIDGTAAWMKLTMGMVHKGNTASIETVIPSSPTWRLVRLTVPLANANSANALVHNDAAIVDMGTPIVSAQACFTGWNRASLSQLAQVDETTWLAADRIANGMDLFAPQTVQPGQKIYVIVEQGSVDADTVLQGMASNASWYAINPKTYKKVFPISLSNTVTVGTQTVAEFVVPTSAPKGSYLMTVVGGAHAVYIGDFAFEVD